MSFEFFKRACAWTTLGLLMVSAFFIRLENFKGNRARTIDEVVYYRMAQQMKVDFFDYNTIPYAQELIKKGRELPDYFTRPLYKYPPLFTMMMAQSLRTFGNSGISAIYIPLVCSVLVIPLIYLLGTMIFNRTVGLIAAFFMYIDPVAIICSQKLWVESAMTLFIVCSVIAFVKGLKANDGLFFALGGFFCGLAANVKYPGLFILPPVFVYTWFHRRELLRREWFWAAMLLPVLMLLPWVMWNAAVYGQNFMSVQAGTHTFGEHTKTFVPRLVGAAGLAVMVAIFFWRRRNPIPEERKSTLERRYGKFIWAGILGAAVVAELSSLWRAMHFYTLPRAGWFSSMFANELPTFYFGQLVEFAPVYVFAYAAYIFLRKEISPEERFVQYVAMGNLFFYLIWGNFQSRYILSSVPFFLLLSAGFIYKWGKHLSSGNVYWRAALGPLLAAFVVYSVAKTHHINQVLSFTNNLCYF